MADAGAFPSGTSLRRVLIKRDAHIRCLMSAPLSGGKLSRGRKSASWTIGDIACAVAVDLRQTVPLPATASAGPASSKDTRPPATRQAEVRATTQRSAMGGCGFHSGLGRTLRARISIPSLQDGSLGGAVRHSCQFDAPVFRSDSTLRADHLSKPHVACCRIHRALPAIPRRLDSTPTSPIFRGALRL